MLYYYHMPKENQIPQPQYPANESVDAEEEYTNWPEKPEVDRIERGS